MCWCAAVGFGPGTLSACLVCQRCSRLCARSQRQAVSIITYSTAAVAAVSQGMMLLAGSTTVYQVLPDAGEKKKQKLQVPRLVAALPSRPQCTVEMLVQHVTCKNGG